MTIAIKSLLIGVMIVLLSAIFPNNLLELLSVPLEGVQEVLHNSAYFLSQLCNFGDIFLLEGTFLIIIKGLSLTIYFYAIFKILYPVLKLIIY